MQRHLFSLLLLGFSLGLSSPLHAEYYQEPPQFHFTPDPAAPRTEIGRLGPIGLALELRKPNFTIYIKSVEAGSPAAATEKLKPGQIIESINGEVLKDIDPRVQLGNMITRIEATDGVVKFMIKDDGFTNWPAATLVALAGRQAPT
jgi:C-terminal processing protease CtpA/Prc